MTANTSKNSDYESSLPLLRKQRSHVLFVLSDANAGHEAAFLDWYRGPYRKAVSNLADTLSVRQYERHEVDVTHGRYTTLPLGYLALHEISVDGALAAEGLIERITGLHKEQAAARAPATWLYYPASEKVGRSPATSPSLLTLAFANGTPGEEAEFREWYATRHIRHAMNVAGLVSGQTFERTVFQRPGAYDATFATIAIYEQEGTPEAMIESFATIPEGALRFPMLDLGPSRFSESVYRPVM